MPVAIALILGDIVEVKSVNGKLLAKGAVNYSAKEMELIKGKKTTDILEMLGYHIYDEAVHRDNLVVLNNEEK